MSSIRRFLDRIYESRKQMTITFAGLDGGGKTTLLYLLKLNEIVTTIPTFGFNVETFRPPTLTKQGTIKEADIEITGWDAGVGCAGPKYMVQLLQSYIDRADALVWVVDSCDHERLQASADELKDMLRVFRSWKYGQGVEGGNELAKEDVSEKPKQKPILVLANKQDLRNPKTVDDVRKAFSGALSGAICAVYPTTLTAGLTAESGIPQAFDWLKLAVEISREILKDTNAPKQKPSSSRGSSGKEENPPHQASIRTPGNIAPKLDSWLTRLEEDPLTPDKFLMLFDNVALPNWDHYTHIRLAYYILKIHGCQKGKDMIFSGISNYIFKSKDSQTTGKSFHFTMTYFWVQIVHFGMQNMSQDFVPIHDKEDSRAWIDDFAHFLIINPFVVDGQLWVDYYSKDVIMTPAAKSAMVLPDKKPLPSIAARDLVAKLLSVSAMS